MFIVGPTYNAQRAEMQFWCNKDFCEISSLVYKYIFPME